MLPSQEFQALLNSLSEVQRTQVAAIQKRLLALGFGAIFTRVVEGPVVRTYTFTPQGLTRFSTIMGAAKEEEVAGALHVESVRIERVLGDVNISVPREDRQIIRFDQCLHQMMTSPLTADMALPLLMGQNTIGEQLYADLSVQPHLLIAGATNSGKSVFTTQLISSLALFRSSAELEFTLVDTKNLDLVLFKTLRHVRAVISDLEDLRSTLEDLLKEVRNRNEKMSGIARNIKEWNAMGVAMPMAYKVLIIDELADIVDADASILKQYTARERPESIQTLIKQITQISRAAGIHIIVATQRPSVKVTPGDMKANLPARICFKLPTRVDSQVVLDDTGAENLLGMGDYLYKIAGSDVIKRAHSAFVSMTDIATIIEQNEQIRKSYQR